jgi:hypothetical protein
MIDSQMPYIKSTREILGEFLKTEEAKLYVKDMLSPFVKVVYNEIYPYIWMICLYHVFLIFMVILNLYILIHWNAAQK